MSNSGLKLQGLSHNWPFCFNRGYFLDIKEAIYGEVKCFMRASFIYSCLCFCGYQRGICHWTNYIDVTGV